MVITKYWCSSMIETPLWSQYGHFILRDLQHQLPHPNYLLVYFEADYMSLLPL
jgi:hypothetical protein